MSVVVTIQEFNIQAILIPRKMGNNYQFSKWTFIYLIFFEQFYVPGTALY